MAAIAVVPEPTQMSATSSPGTGVGADQILAELYGLLRWMDAPGHRRHKKHISGIAAAIVGLGALPFKFPIVGACTASGMNAGVWLAVSKLRIVDRGLLVKYQDILGLFQRSPVCIEKACSALLVPNLLKSYRLLHLAGGMTLASGYMKSAVHAPR